MTSTASTQTAAAPAGAPATTKTRTRMLLTGGVVAGPLFIAVGLAQAFTRAGFDPIRHPLSLLSLGDLGWIQITNFVTAGLLFLGAAVGVRRVLQGGRAGTWGPLLLGAFGVALVAGGVFLADAGLGFPPGAPQTTVHDVSFAELSWHGKLHGVAPPLGFLSLSLACFVFARRAAGLRQRGWAVLCVAVGVVIQVLGALPNGSGNFVPLWIAMAAGFCWASAQVAQVRKLLQNG
jgi:hypothetical protein